METRGTDRTTASRGKIHRTPVANKDIATRYTELARRRGITKYATQREIASYLNVTEFTLSRVVRRLNMSAESADELDDPGDLEDPVFDPLATLFGEPPRIDH